MFGVCLCLLVFACFRSCCLCVVFVLLVVVCACLCVFGFVWVCLIVNCGCFVVFLLIRARTSFDYSPLVEFVCVCLFGLSLCVLDVRCLFVLACSC